MDKIAEGLPDMVGYFPGVSYESSALQNILKKVPVSSIFPNSSRRGRKANAPRKRTYPLPINAPQEYGGDGAPLRPDALDLAGVSPALLTDVTAGKKPRRASERSRKTAIKSRTAIDRKDMSQKILNLTMEIISVLAGEECTVMTKSGEPVVPRNYLVVPGGASLKEERQSDQKILDLTFQIIQLLSGEGPTGCDDSTSSWKGKNKSPHKGVIVERSSPATFAGSGVTDLGNTKLCRASGHIDHEVGMISESGTYVQTVTTPFKDQRVKDEAGEEDVVGESEFTAVRVKEESAPCEEAAGGPVEDTQFLSIKIKEESVSDGEGNVNVTESYATPRYKKRRYASKYRAEDTDSGGDNDSTTLTAADFEQYPSIHPEPPPMLFPHSGGPVDFLGFDDNSNLDTDVNALIKHAHTKFSFAPIEGGSGSEEEEPLPEPEIQPPSKDEGPQKSAANTDEPNSGEEGTSEEAAVTSTKKDRTLKTYTCSECHECFLRRSDFANHRRDHRRERLTCPECGKVFANKPSLLNHLTGHTGEKPYSCPVCGKCFTRNSNLIVHQATHIERSPFTSLNVTDMLVKQIM